MIEPIEGHAYGRIFPTLEDAKAGAAADCPGEPTYLETHLFGRTEYAWVYPRSHAERLAQQPNIRIIE